MSGPLATPRFGHGGAELVWRPAPRLRRATRSEGARPVARLLVDVLSLIIAGGVSGSDDAVVLGAWEWVLIAVAVGVLAAAGAYRPRRSLRLDEELRRVVVGLGLACIAVAAAAMLGGGRSGLGDAVTVLWLAASAIAGAGRLALYAGERATAGRGTPQGRTLIVGAGHVGRLTARRLLARPQLGLRPVGFLDKEPLDAAEAPAFLPVLGASWDLERVVEAEEIDTVVVAFSTAPHHVLLDLVRRSWKLGADVMLVPRLYEVEGRRLRTEHLGGLPLIAVGTSDPRGVAFTLKYAIDRIVAGIALVFLAPVLAVAALAVRCSLGRPILFRQQRVGLDGHVFEMLKFRTMHGAPDEHGEADAGWAALVLSGEAGEPVAARRMAAVSRRSRVGDVLRKLSLDELPQLWNVVRGDMSLVGPRPERSHYVEQFEDVVYRYGDRHRVKSGLTGWAQVHGLRGETSLADRIEWDNFYIENWSFWLDLKILVMTLPALVGRRGGR